MLIGLVGKKGVGKDLVANKLVEKFNFLKYAFADPIKKISKILFLFNEKQLYGHQSYKEKIDPKWDISPRKVFQFLGDTMRNSFQEKFPNIAKKIGNNSFWIHHFKMWYEQQKCKNVVVADVRYPNEAAMIKKLGGILIQLNRKTKFDDKHQSENQKINVDYVIDNNYSKEKLLRQVFEIINIKN